MITRKNLQSIMNLAWRFVKLNNMTLSDALKISWKNAKLYHKLCHSTATFQFLKNDGNIRYTTGTLSFHHIPPMSLPSGANAGKHKNDMTQVYFDIDKQAWRSFKRANLISISI